MPAQFKASQVRITGRVQGVGFRDWTVREARQLGLVGWVSNEADGSVAALLVGPDDAVAAMLERLWKGPRFALVSDVTSRNASVAELPVGFRITG